MGQRYRSLVAVLVAICAMGAVGVASASAALPEFNNRTSSTEKFSGSGGSVILETRGGNAYRCTYKATGEVEPGKSKTIKNVVLTVEGCSSFFCTPDKLTFKPLTGTLGYLDKATKSVGLLLKPSSGSLVAECTYLAEKNKVEIRDSLITPIYPTDKETARLELKLKQTRGVQEVRHFEGEAEIHNLEFKSTGVLNTEWEELGLESTIVMTSEQKVEIEA